jgi:hypothetical protein
MAVAYVEVLARAEGLISFWMKRGLSSFEIDDHSGDHCFGLLIIDAALQPPAALQLDVDFDALLAHPLTA